MQKSAAPDETAGTRARGRPRAFDRAAALQAATLLFWQKGFDATSITDLTAAMGIGSPSLYAAFGSKEALFAEALDHYVRSNEAFVWKRFFAAPTARGAIEAFLFDSAAALTGAVADIPRGCMVTLSTVDGAEHGGLCDLLRTARQGSFERLHDRLRRGKDEGEFADTVDLPALARFVQTVQGGMSILARDGARGDELEAVAELAMLGWDARVGAGT
ncbi:TetR/AcrR family transcriptional regulator [Sphingomonas sp. Y38-1Y]|uniref:TetR/AcrR family transcriptional regulator n=1 Tax=Sphingomonas sp. Y38-1Y TaxID=3078265 RepID=UPI0028E2927B|nr:TetR/AcrR family transcriptional regulator [Sphingomonas sp. Y38-1Y]